MKQIVILACSQHKKRYIVISNKQNEIDNEIYFHFQTLFFIYLHTSYIFFFLNKDAI